VEKLVLNDKIKHYEEILKKIDGEYKNAMTIDWPKIREKDRFLIKEISRIKKLQKNKSLATNSSRIIEENKSFAKNDASHKLPKDMVPNEEEKWDINNNILLESYEEEEEEKYNSDIFTDSDNNIDFLDDESIHNLENAMEAMEVELGKGEKRRNYGEISVKSERESERPHRVAGKWPLEREEYSYNYIPEEYKFMDSKRRSFEKSVKFQNHKTDGAILILATHDPRLAKHNKYLKRVNNTKVYTKSI
jgi:hypothetical protein